MAESQKAISATSSTKQTFYSRLSIAVKDLYNLHSTKPWAFSRAQRRQLKAYSSPQELVDELLGFIPPELQSILGTEETVSLEDILAFEALDGFQPDAEPGVYLGIGITDDGLPCLYVGMSSCERGSKFRIAQHLSPSYRANSKPKLFYAYIDDPETPRELHFVMLSKIPRNSKGLKAHGVARMLLVEQLMINRLGTMDPNARSRFMVDFASLGCVPLPAFLATNRDSPVIGSENKPNDVLSAEEIAQKLKDARARPEYKAKQKVLNNILYHDFKTKRDSGDPEAAKTWEKKKAQNKASDARRKAELAEGLKRGDPEAIRKDAARKETMRKANAKRRGKSYIPKEAAEKENEPPVKRAKMSTEI